MSAEAYLIVGTLPPHFRAVCLEQEAAMQMSVAHRGEFFELVMAKLVAGMLQVAYEQGHQQGVRDERAACA